MRQLNVLIRSADEPSSPPDRIKTQRGRGEREQVYEAWKDVNTSQLTRPPTCDLDQIHFYLTMQEMKVHRAILL